jgi:hypothetical protein
VKRVGLLLAAAIVPVIAGCGTAPRVPEWNAGGAPPSPAASALSPAPVSPSPTTASPTTPSPSAPASADAAATWPAPAAVAPSPSAGFVAAVRGRLPQVALDLRPEEITELGDQACAGLAAGERRVTVAKGLSGYGLSAPEATALVALAGSHLCSA